MPDVDCEFDTVTAAFAVAAPFFLFFLFFFDFDSVVVSLNHGLERLVYLLPKDYPCCYTRSEPRTAGTMRKRTL